ncbi:hypothetical protein NB570_18135, partial [Vibrio parahaemolyticus]|uniref:hypothetical protein n=1 Tax=Vibrio parahaemolyticus TaxID=670 RepID=UPI00215C129A
YLNSKCSVFQPINNWKVGKRAIRLFSRLSQLISLVYLVKSSATGKNSPVAELNFTTGNLSFEVPWYNSGRRVFPYIDTNVLI